MGANVDRQVTDQTARKLLSFSDIGIAWTTENFGDSRTAMLCVETGVDVPYRNDDHHATWAAFPRLTAHIRIRDRTAAVAVRDRDPLTDTVSCVFHRTIPRRNGQWHQIHVLRMIAEDAMQSASLTLQETHRDG